MEKKNKNKKKTTGTRIFIFTQRIVGYSGRVNWSLGLFNTTIYSTGNKKGPFSNEDNCSTACPLHKHTGISHSNSTLFFFFFLILRRMGKDEAQAPTLSRYQIRVVFQFNPTLPLQQQLALLLPGA